MTWDLALRLINMAGTVTVLLVVWGWKGGEWTGTERRKVAELVDDVKKLQEAELPQTQHDLGKRMDQANIELSRLTGQMQQLISLGTDLKVLTSKFDTLHLRIEGPEGIAKRLHGMANQWSSIELLKRDCEHLSRRLLELERHS